MNDHDQIPSDDDFFDEYEEDFPDLDDFDNVQDQAELPYSQPGVGRPPASPLDQPAFGSRPGGGQQPGQPPRLNLPGSQGQPGGISLGGQAPRPNLPGAGQPGGQQPGQPPRPNLLGSQGQPGGQQPGQPLRPNLPGTGQFGGQQPGQPLRPNLPGTGQFGGQQPGQPPRPNLPGSQGQPSGISQGGQAPRPNLPGSQGQPGGQQPGQPLRPNLPGSQGQPGGQQQPGQPPRTNLPGSQGQPGGLAQGGQAPRPNLPGAGQSGGQPPRPNLPGSQGQPGGQQPGQPPRPVTPGGQPGQNQQGQRPPGAGPAAPVQGGQSQPKPRSPLKPSASTQTGVRPMAPGAPPAAEPRKREPKAKAGAVPRGRSLPSVEGITIKTRVVDPNAPLEPPWIQRIQKMLPSFSDEVTALALIALGLLSFFTLVNPQSGELGGALAGFLSQTFGWGAFVVAGVILASGMIILAPKVNIDIPINWWRVIWGEVFFIVTLAFTHGLLRLGYPIDLAREEAIGLALEGQGGGFVGWAIQEMFSAVVGDIIADFLLLILMVVTAGLTFGVSREQVIPWLAGLENRFMSFAFRMEGRQPRPQAVSEPVPAAEEGPAPTLVTFSPQPEVAPAAAVAADGRAMVELPAIPGRPSIITGETGAGAASMHTFEPGPTRIANLRRQLAEEGIENVPEIKYRFSLKEAPDKKKFKKRSSEAPPLEILDAIDYARPEEDEVNINAQIIEETVEDFGMRVEVVGVRAGPTVTQYAVQPFSEVEQDGKKVVTRVRVTRVAALAQDLSLALAAPRVRIQAPVPGTNYIGVEVPNARPGIVSMRPVIESERFFKVRSSLTIALGRDVGGKPMAADLATMPHLLIGGTTGSGKSVCLAALTTCLVFNNRPDELRLIMIDPKMVELIRFNGLPHLLGHVEVELERIIGVLRWVTREMDRRYKLMEEAQARNILVYNQIKKKKDRLPYMVVLIDELAELMTEYHDETEHLLTRLAQMARATGIHLVVATQRPSTDVVTGLIKANFPARIAFAVASSVDSRVIIDSVGAEDLIGRGDMLYYASDAAGPIRLQGCFVSDAELDRLVEYWRAHWTDEEEGEEAPWERSLTRAAVLEETDQMLEEAIRLIQKEGEASASLLQRRLNVSYPRAGRIIDSLYKMGLVGEPQAGGRSRRLLISPSIDATTYIVTWRQNHPNQK